MSKELTLHYGELEKREWPDYPINNTLLIGTCGSGKTNVLTNILSELVLRYRPLDVVVSLWDGLGIDFAHAKGNYGFEFCDISRVCVNSVEGDLISFLENLYSESTERYKTVTGSGCKSWGEFCKLNEDKFYPIHFIVLEEPAATLSKLHDEKVMRASSIISAIMKNANLTGMYTLISTQGLQLAKDYRLDKDDFDTIVCTRVHEELSEELFGSNIATNTCMKSYGNACVKDISKDIVMLNVPFYYTKSKIAGILKKKILPQGVLFDDNRLNQWGIFMQGSFIGAQFDLGLSPIESGDAAYRASQNAKLNSRGGRPLAAHQADALDSGEIIKEQVTISDEALQNGREMSAAGRYGHTREELEHARYEKNPIGFTERETEYIKGMADKIGLTDAGM